MNKFTLVLCMLLAVYGGVYAQNTEQTEGFIEQPAAVGQDFFIAPLVELSGYASGGFACGGGLIIGSGDETAIGLRILYTIDPGNFAAMEILFFLRYYLFGPLANTGPLIELNGGPVIFSDVKPEISGYGTISAGLCVGWRFTLGKNFYIELAVRAGYPYLFGGGLSSGFRF